MTYRLPATNSVRDGLLALAGSIVDEADHDVIESRDAALLEVEIRAAMGISAHVTCAWEIDLDDPADSELVGYRVVLHAH